MFEKIKRNINHPEKIIIKLGKVSPLVPDELYLKAYYFNLFGKRLNLNAPQTFNEKLQWLKLHDRRPEYTAMVDKYAAKQFAANICEEMHIIPTLGVWEHFDDIDFDALPQKFVLKCTHDSGGLVICKDKRTFDKSAAKEKIEKCLKRNFYLSGREWPYKNVPRRIIAEEYLESLDTDGLADYKLMVFNGKVEATFVCTDRFSSDGLKITFFDRDWNRLPCKRQYHSTSNIEIPKPKTYDTMIRYAELMSKGIPFLRADFYEIQGQLFFGELTFYPASGFEKFEPEYWDRTFGDMLDISAIQT